MQWIKECQGRHPKCEQPANKRLLTRVLGAGGPDDQIFLRETLGALKSTL